MKKVTLLLSIVVSTLSANAQLYLSGTGPYTQNFNSISSSLPTGWYGYTDAGPAFMGSVWSFNGSRSLGIYDTTNTPCISAVLAAGFKNFASATVASAGDTCGTQQAYTDRAFGVRQAANTASSAGGHYFDSGAAFVLKLANTHGMTGVNVGFRFQSLDTTSRKIVKWKLQYGIGSNPTSFTDVVTTPAALTTGGGVFKNDTVTASFGTGLDNVEGSNVIIRLVTLDYSSFSGNRPCTAIDNFSMSWSGIAKTGIVDLAANGTLPLNVVSASTSAIELNFNAEDAGNYTLTLTDMVGRTVATQSVEATHGNQNVSVNSLALASGIYVAKIGNGVTSGITKVSVQ